MVAYKCWLHRLSKLLLDEKNNRRELGIIINIAISNGYRKRYNKTVQLNKKSTKQ
jgi:hypothetical protein